MNEFIEKSQERLDILKKIEEYERKGLFDLDVENDPPTIELKPDMVDYLNKKLSSKIKTKFANYAGRKFIKKLIKDNVLIIDEIKGLEHYNSIKGGAIITANHFNPFDCLAMQYAYEQTKHFKKKTFFKVIREGNYTNFPGFYGKLFRNCNTLPLSSNRKTMMNFMRAVSHHLSKGHLINIYPEQSMWWNYKKPKPLKKGAYSFAAKANVPVVPCFITMEDSDILGEDGFYIQEYTIHVGKPIYPNDEFSKSENVEFLLNENYNVWKNIYEDFYKIPLKYDTK